MSAVAGFRPLRNVDHLFYTTAAEVLAPPPAPDFEAWAVDHVRFGDESPFPGPYDPARFPFFKRVFEVLSPEHPARIVTLAGSAQIGKSVVCQVFTGATLDLDPCQFIYYHPTEGNATEWARLKWKPFLLGSARLTELLGEERSRDGSRSLLFYERRDGRGSLTVAGSNSGPAVSMKSARCQVQDDLAKWEVLPSGDSETQADSRSKAFLFAKILKVSTPLLEHNCRITRNYKAGTQERYHVPCPRCGVLQPLEWENMAACLDEADPDDAHFTCVGCGERIEESDRAGCVDPANGACWIADNPGAREVSLYLWAAYSPLESWGNIARAWLAAKGNPAAEQTFFNDHVGRAYKGAGEAPPWEEIRERAEQSGHALGRIPHGGLYFVAGADCQKDRVEVHLKAFGRDGRRWTVEYRVLEGHISTEKARAALDALLRATWPDDYGNARGLEMLAIDGNAYTQDVMAWARSHPWERVIVVRGAKSETAPPLVPVQSERKPDGRTRRQQKRFYNVGVSGLKTTLYTALAKRDPLERGYCGYPRGLEEEFYRQLAAERREPVKRRTGFIEYRWVKDATQANEVLDTEIYAEAAAIRRGWRMLTESLADQREAALMASGEKRKQAGQPDLFDPARPAVEAASETDESRPAVRQEAPEHEKSMARILAERFARLNGAG